MCYKVQIQFSAYHVQIIMLNQKNGKSAEEILSDEI